MRAIPAEVHEQVGALLPVPFEQLALCPAGQVTEQLRSLLSFVAEQFESANTGVTAKSKTRDTQFLM
jgi:hypothetical protein